MNTFSFFPNSFQIKWIFYTKKEDTQNLICVGTQNVGGPTFSEYSIQCSTSLEICKKRQKNKDCNYENLCFKNVMLQKEQDTRRKANSDLELILFRSQRQAFAFNEFIIINILSTLY